MEETQLRNHRDSTTAATAPTTMKNINKNRSISDADSPISQVDSFHSPLHSPFHSDKSPPKSPSMAIVAVSDDKYYSPLRSPPRLDNSHRKQRQDNLNFPPPPTPPAMNSKMILDRAVKEDITAGVTKVGPTGGSEGLGYDVEGVGGERRSRPAVASISRRSRKDETVERVALGLRVCEMILCLISFSVMAADKTEGWSGDSFDRYREYRYCLSMNVISFLYSGLQACDLTYHLATGKHFISHHLRYHFDFVMDQILAYLLVSASSSAATRVDDWVSNWGKDQFTEMASASIGVSFVAFLAFALSSLISGYNLCNPVSSVL